MGLVAGQWTPRSYICDRNHGLAAAIGGMGAWADYWHGYADQWRHTHRDCAGCVEDPGLTGAADRTRFARSYIYASQSGLGAYLFAGLEARLVARNIFLDGNSFYSSPRVAKAPAVGDLLLGAAIAIKSARLSFVHVFRSPEYTKQ